MNVSDVIHGRISSADLRRADREPFPASLQAKSEVAVEQSSCGEAVLVIGNDRWEVEGVGSTHSSLLQEVAQRGMPTLAWLVQFRPTKAHNILVRFHEFTLSLHFPESMEIGVDERTVDDIRRRLRRQISASAAAEWLAECLLLPPRKEGESSRALLSGTPVGERTAFRLHGNGFAIDVQRNDDDRLVISRVVESRRKMEGSDARPIYLVAANIEFRDASVAGAFRGAAQVELDQILAQADSYLGFWQAYNNKERQIVLDKARQFGWTKYSKRSRDEDGSWRFDISVNKDQLADLWPRLEALEGEQIEAGAEVPLAIEGADDTAITSGNRRPFIGELARQTQNPPQIYVRPQERHEDREPPKEGYLFVALGGDEVRVKRREDAWEKVVKTENPMPQLGLLLEGQPVPEARRRTLQPMTRAVRDVFDSPSDRQRSALNVALNTPDIALIQGPPGTGKTRIIAALQARLAERDEGVSENGLAGNTLLTSYQHDAVENAAAATRVMGLPAVKVGYRAGTEEARDGVEVWAHETAEAVRAARASAPADVGVHKQTENLVNVEQAARASAPADVGVHAALRKVREIGVAFLQAPAEKETPASVLAQVSELASPWLPGELADELMRLRTEVSTPLRPALGDENTAGAVKAVRALRTDAIAFADDGPRNAFLALQRLRRLEGFPIEDAEAEALERAGEPGRLPTEDLLMALRAAKDALLDRLQPPKVNAVNPRHADADAMIVRVIDALTVRAKESAPGVDVAVDDWLATLEKDPDGTRDAVRHYSMVLAATCQQAVSRPMTAAKHGEDTVFRTVIVDEAARANPLDLLIPMSLAERRIVLVGDHRQLPHLLERDIERELQQSAEDAEDIQEEMRSALRLSLFEKLFTDLQRRDGIRRTVTLDCQYRMHPQLGSFVSAQFYEPHGEAFESGRGEEEFAHDVSIGKGASLVNLAGKVAAWVDVPLRQGEESRGRSKRREVEARRIAEEAQAVITGHSELSVGVVTFYAAQRDQILSSMTEQGLTERTAEDAISVREEWRLTADGRERLRVGTVDSFQGKEFDVVFLSLTRSNRVQGDNEMARRRRYGFLLLENRLCVAMSRQQRLLVVVGDAAMATGAEAQSAVPALTAFLKLCEGPHGHVLRA